jgi:hypothetical protein
MEGDGGIMEGVGGDAFEGDGRWGYIPYVDDSWEGFNEVGGVLCREVEGGIWGHY